MKIYKGKVKYIAGAPREGQYGPSINVLIDMLDGSVQRIYGKPGDAIERLKSGQDVQMVEEKGKYKLVEAEYSADAPVKVEEPVVVITDEEKLIAIENRALFWSSVYKKIYVDLTADETIDKNIAVSAASTVFISIFKNN